MMGVIELRGDSIVILYGNSATSEAYPEGSISTESIISQSRRGYNNYYCHHFYFIIVFIYFYELVIVIIVIIILTGMGKMTPTTW